MIEDEDDPRLVRIDIAIQRGEHEKIRQLMVEATDDPNMLKLTQLLDKVTRWGKYTPRRFDRADLLSYFASKRLDLKYWKPLYILTLRQWGYNMKSASDLYDWGVFGHNWEKLHPDENEQRMPPDQCLDMFYGEVSYCSDRMSLDRLFRCHWLFNHYNTVLHHAKNKK